MRSRSKVSSVEIEIRSASSSRSRGSIPRARSRSSRPTWPGRSARSSASESAASSPIRCTPARASRSSARGPTPGRSRVGRGARKRASRPGGTTVIPPGLRRSDATLQTTLDVETPSEHDSDVEPRTAACTASARRPRLGERAPRRSRDRGSPRRARSARRAAQPLGSPTTPPASTGDTARAAAAGTRRRGSVGAPRLRSSPSGSRTAWPRSSRSRRRRGPAGRRRRRGASSGGTGPRAPRRLRRTRRDRDARGSARPVQGYGSAVIDTAPPPRPPVVERPAAYQVSYGAVEGRAAPGTKRVVVRVDGKVVGDFALRGRSFSLGVPLPPREVRVRVETVDGEGHRAGRTVLHVLGLPPAARPVARPLRLDRGLEREVRRLVDGYPGSGAGLRRGPRDRCRRRVERARDVPGRLDAEARDRRDRSCRGSTAHLFGEATSRACCARC